MKNCIVTGGAGFIGSNLSQKLIELGHKVTVIDNLSTGIESNLKKVKEKINFKKLDISKIKDLDQVSFQDVDWVFHLAGIADIVPSIQNPDKYFMSNVLGTLNVLQKSKSAKVKKFIYAASASCYGIPDNFPTKESEKIKPEYPYALTKNIAEQLVMHWAKIYDMPNISLRFFNAYGPNSRTTGAYGAMFGVFLAQKLNNKPLTIVGDGKQTRDFIHVSDLVEAVIKIADSKKNNEIYNLASGKETSVNYIAKIIGGETIKIPKRPGEPDRSLADISKIKKEINWEPKIKIEDGVKMMLKIIDNWKEAPVWTPEKITEATKPWFRYLNKKGLNE
jgi:UDP-glucose 4-epimerase